MVRPPAELGSLRFSRLEKERLLLALLFSLMVHLGVWGGYEVGKKTGLWQKLHWPKRQVKLVEVKPPMDTAQPTVFVDVADASAEAPKEAKFYSDKNSRAANPEADVDSNQPKLTGTQTDVPKTQDTPRPVKAPPTPPTPPTPPQPDQKAQPEQTDVAHTLNPGNLEKAQKNDNLNPDPKPQTPERPRTLQQARAMQQNQIPGMQMKQDGGVRNRNFTSSLDALSTSFGSYDRAVIAAISSRWYDLLDSQKFALDRTGKVTVTFHLNPDGSVTESTISNNTVGNVLGYICQEAIEQAAPFGKWPSDMRLKFGAFREITFTFYYY